MTSPSRRPVLEEMFRSIAALSRSTKRTIMGTADSVVLAGSALAAFWIVSPGNQMPVLPLVIVAIVAGQISLRLTGCYRSVVRFMGLELLLSAFRVAVFTALVVLLSVRWVANWPDAVKIAITFSLLLIAYVAGSRLLVQQLLRAREGPGDRIIIYGAGEAGVRLSSAFASRGKFSLVAFVDDNSAIHGSVINGLPVHSPSDIDKLVREFEVSRVLLALPSVTRRQRREIINHLERLPVHVQTIPDLHDLILGHARVEDIREVEIEDLLGRDVVTPIPELLGPHIAGRSVLVTGAGGSIGSELSAQILKLSPNHLILLESSEAALYEIDQRLRSLKRQHRLETELVPLIGSAHHKARVVEVLKAYSVNTIYHAAAYKHVPLVEHNMLEGVHNNVFGTLHTAEAAIEAGVHSFVLVSTDKAVKPTNVMGATKRYAELVLQALEQRQTGTRFSMVRFGNVLASSGSVVPRFREQIRAGGPVTVTHPEIYRYFMTISEAASLVLQAGSMARGGEVFVLDMGEPVKIVDLAEKMIHLMGLTVRDDDNRDGDIEIEFTGLRPAEKLYEELLIGSDVSGTKHPRIMQAREHFFTWDVLQPMLDKLLEACDRQDCEKARALLLEGVIGYSPTAEVEDLLWRQRSLKEVGDATEIAAANVTRLEPRRSSGVQDKAPRS